jgi:hypothetical protein
MLHPFLPIVVYWRKATVIGTLLRYICVLVIFENKTFSYGSPIRGTVTKNVLCFSLQFKMNIDEEDQYYFFASSIECFQFYSKDCCIWPMNIILIYFFLFKWWSEWVVDETYVFVWCHSFKLDKHVFYLNHCLDSSLFSFELNIFYSVRYCAQWYLQRWRSFLLLV